MDYNIKALLHKFWNGESSLEEDILIKEYFLHNEKVPAELKYDQAYFSCLQQRKQVQLHDDLASQIDFTAIKEKPQILYLSKKLLKYAAVFFPLLLLGYFIYQRTVNKSENVITAVDTFNDPKHAITIVEKELLSVSLNLNEVASQLQSASDFKDLEKPVNKKDKPR